MQHSDTLPRVFDQLEIMELQFAARQLEIELLGRYVSDPSNMEQLREVLGNAFEGLAAIVSARGCPGGWYHMRCKCVPPYMQCVVGEGGGEGPMEAAD